MRSRLGFLALLVLSVTAESPKPNVVLIVTDDFGIRDASYRGGNQILTPNIDSLAYHGVAFDYFYTGHICTPSRAALMTGKYAHNIGLQAASIPATEPWAVGLEHTFMSSYFRDNGYKTHLVGKWHLGHFMDQYTPTNRGFTSHYGYYNGWIDYYNQTHDPQIAGLNYVGYDFHVNGTTYKGQKNGSYVTDLFNDEAVRIINQHDVSDPLFLKVAYSAPHVGNFVNQAPQNVANKFSFINDPKRQVLAAMISIMDESVGNLLTAVKEKGILSNTIFVFVNDNGAGTFGPQANSGSNFPLKGQRSTNWEGGVRNHGLIYYTGLNRQRVYNGLVHVSDILPTLAEAAGMTLEAVDGISHWKNLMNGDDSARTEVVSVLDNVNGISAIVDHEWKLLNGSYKNGVFDQYLGAIQEVNLSPENYAKAVFNSKATKALTTVEIVGRELTIGVINRLRTFLTIPVDDHTSLKTPCNPLVAPCLFNIKVDPTESNNLANVYPAKLEALLTRMNDLVASSTPSIRVAVNDPNSNPALHGGNWEPWIKPSVQ